MTTSEKERIAENVNGNSENGVVTPEKNSKHKSKNRGILTFFGAVGIAVVAALIGGMIGYNMKPVAKIDDLVVSEDVSGPV